MKKAIIVLFFLSIYAELFSALLFDPQLKWKSIKTEHFWIHYHQGIEEQAQKLAIIAENVHKRLAPVIQWEPALRTDVVLADNFYTANGFSMPFPFNRIQIYLTKPELDGVLNNFDDWLEMVFIHEYTHTLSIDMVHWFPAGLRLVFGRLPLFPNAFLPMWMIEGNAVYHESNYSRFGRNNSTYTDMVMRTEVLNNSLKSISESSNFPRTWPVGNVPYLYGGLFVEYLEKKYGTGSMAEVFVWNSNKIFPYQDNIFPYILPFIKSMSEWEYGEPWYKLWDEWQEYTKIKYTGQIEKINKQALTEYKKVTDSGYITSLPRFGSNGNKIYYIRNTNYNKTSLMSYDLAEGKTRSLCQVNDPNSISVSNSGSREKVYLSDAEFHRSYSIYNEAFVYNSGRKKLTSKLKGSYIDISPDGNRTCFIKQDKLLFSLVISNPSFDKFENIISDSRIQMAYARFSPDGQRIAFSLRDKDGNSDIAVLDIETRNIIRVTDDLHNDIQPVWHPDGSRIVFSSDRNGVYNLYEYDIKKKTIIKITNLLGGAFSPDISPDGKMIVFACYGKSGFDIATMKYNYISEPQTADPIDLSRDFFNQAEDIAPRKAESTEFTIFNTIFPPFWLPIIATADVYDGKTQSLIGVSTFGADTLFKNIYLLSAYYYTYEKRVNVDLYYLFGYFYPDIIFEYHDDRLFLKDDEFPWEDKNNKYTRRETERSGIAGIAFPFYYYQSFHILSFSYKYSESHTDSYKPGISTTKLTDTEARIRAKYMYNNAKKYSYSISGEDGRDFFIAYDYYSSRIGSDLSYTKIFGDYNEYLPGIWRNNATAIRLRGGASFDNPAYKDPFPLGRFQKGDTGTPDVDEDVFGLRGYPYGSIFGKRMAAGSIEYRFPVIQGDFGIVTFPLMFRDLWLSPFAEYGNVWEKETDINDFKSSAGVELHVRITVGYVVDLEGFIGYARGFDKYGEDQVYFGISTVYEGAFKNNYKWLDYL